MKKLSCNLLFFALSAQLACAGVAVAQEATMTMEEALQLQAEVDAANASASPEYIETGTVVISATRTEQFVEDVPQTMEVVTAEQIVEMGATNVEQVFASIPGVVITNGRDPLTIRGSGLADISSPLLLIDGRQLPYFETKSDGLGTYLDMIDVSNIERIEIIKGQAGAIYGADALNGVINIITKKGGNEGGLVNLSIGSLESTFSSFYDFGQMGKWDATMNASVKKLMGYKEDRIGYASAGVPNIGWTMNGQGATYSAGGNVGYSFSEDHRVSFSGNASQSISISENTNGTTGVFTRSVGTPIEIYSGTLAYDGQLEEHMLKFDAGMSHTFQSYDMATITMNGQDTWFINDMNSLTGGFQYRLDTQNNNTDVLNAGYIDRSSLGIFLQDEISLFDEKLYLIPAVRFDWNSSFDSALTYQLGGTYEFIPGNRIKASFGTSYSAPILSYTDGAESRGSNSFAPNGTRVIGSKDLKPLNGFAWEVAYEAEFGDFNGSIGYFYKTYDGSYGSQVVYSDDPADVGQPGYIGGTSHAGNPYGTGYEVQIRTYSSLDTSTEGVEMFASYNFVDAFTASIGYIWLDQRQENRAWRLGDYAKHTYTLKLDYNNSDLDLNASLWGQYMQEYGARNNYFDPANASYNAKALDGSPYVFDVYNLNASVSKVWNEKYTTTLAVYNFLTSERKQANDSFVNPLAVTLGLQVKF